MYMDIIDFIFLQILLWKISKKGVTDPRGPFFFDANIAVWRLDMIMNLINVKKSIAM